MDVTGPDAGAFDVSPRTSAATDGPGSTGPRPGRPPRSKGRGVLAVVLVVVVLGAIGFLLIKQLGSASLYYYNADQAVAKKTELGSKRFRIQGTYVGKETYLQNGDSMFSIAFNGAKVLVDNSASQPALFQPGIQVVLDGRWSTDGTEFLSDQIEVKHSATYIAKHPNRVKSTDP